MRCYTGRLARERQEFSKSVLGRGIAKWPHDVTGNVQSSLVHQILVPPDLVDKPQSRHQRHCPADALDNAHGEPERLGAGGGVATEPGQARPPVEREREADDADDERQARHGTGEAVKCGIIGRVVIGTGAKEGVIAAGQQQKAQEYIEQRQRPKQPGVLSSAHGR
eukprot:ctg_129.g75